MTIAVYSSVSFHARYPEFAAVSDVALAACFSEAGLYLGNTDGSPVQDIVRRTTLLNMLTAHISALSGMLGDGQAKPVGRVSNASEGSVSAAFEYIVAGSAAWYTQTQYGTAFWQATVNMRSFSFRPGPAMLL